MIKKSVIITGASSGIGEELARNYVTLGWNVGLIARRLDKIETIKSELEHDSNVKILVSQCDVSNKDAIYNTIQSMIESFGQIDCIIANAGVSYSSPGTQPDSDIFEQTINIINFFSRCTINFHLIIIN